MMLGRVLSPHRLRLPLRTVNTRSFHAKPQSEGTIVLPMAKPAFIIGSSIVVSASLVAYPPARAEEKKKSNENPQDDPEIHELMDQLKKKLQEKGISSLQSLQKSMPDGFDNVQQYVNDLLKSGAGGQLSWGFIMGACSGFTLRKLSKVGAIAVGGIFIGMQTAAYNGYIEVDYQKMERDIMEWLDLNHDGVTDAKDLDELYERVMRVLEFSLPAGSGFAVGFALGFRTG